MTRHIQKLVPIVVALPLFLQQVDGSVMATALPTISRSLHVDALRLNLAITVYLISLAIFLPASGWLAERFGARRVFCCAIALFTFASALCGLSVSLETLVAFRILQGMGGAMMVPIARLLLLQTVAPGAMVSAMVWFTVPPVFGRMLGPLIGGMVVTWVSWRWIFFINIPIGVLAISLALALLDADEAGPRPAAFDFLGFLLLGVGLAALLAGFEAAGSQLVRAPTSVSLIAFGLACLAAYYLKSRKATAPLLDLRVVKYKTFFASIAAGLPLRLGIGAVPFLLPLLFQLAFGLSPLDSGLLTMGTAVGALGSRAILIRTIRKFGFRPLLLVATVLSSLCYFMYGSFTEATPHVLLFAAMMLGGLIISIVMVSLQTLAFSEIPKPLMSHSTALSTMAQQLSISLGVLYAVQLLHLSVWWRNGSTSHLATGDFSLAFFVVGVSVLAALAFILRLPRDVGANLREQ